MSAAEINQALTREKLTAVERFKRELIKDKGKLKLEIQAKKKLEAENIKNEHQKNWVCIIREKKQEKKANEQRKEEVIKIEQKLKESIQQANIRKKKQIIAAQEKEYLEISKMLKTKQRSLSKIHELLREKSNASVSFVHSIDLSDLGFKRRNVSICLGRQSKNDSLKPSLNTTADLYEGSI